MGSPIELQPKPGVGLLKSLFRSFFQFGNSGPPVLRTFLFKKFFVRVGGIPQAIECLPSKQEALSSNCPVLLKKKKNVNCITPIFSFL
jgi:hypothetical protein